MIKIMVHKEAYRKVELGVYRARYCVLIRLKQDTSFEKETYMKKRDSLNISNTTNLILGTLVSCLSSQDRS